jgi:hypothetical protein
LSTATLPDGRVLRVDYDPASGDWTAHLAGAEDCAVTGRWLLRVLTNLLELPRGDRPRWVFDLVGQFAGRDTPLGRRYPCPCCGFLTLTEPPTGTFAICPVCRWEDDNIQFEDPGYEGGANRISLNRARDNFRQQGVSKPWAQGRVREALPEEQP